MNIVFLGAPGSGKGTQSSKITNQYDLISVVAGDILREEKKSGSDIGKEIASIIDKGNLVPDKMIDEIIEKYLWKCAISNIPTGYVFDGYPRTIGQGKNLDRIMSKYDTEIDVVFFLDVDQEILVKRLLERGKTSGREDDKDEDTIRQRMKNYFELTEPLKSFYKDKIIIIDGSESVDEINEIIKENMTRLAMRKIIKK